LIIKGDSDSYSKYSRLVTDVIAGAVPMFEKSSIDEFYVDMSGMDKFFGCALYTKELRKKIENESGLNISYGLASNKLISKVATDEAKPHGQLEIPFGCEKSFLAPLPVEKLPMVGPKTGTLLKRMGVETINILSQIPLDMMTNLMGKNGIELHRRSNGIDETPIVPFHEQKSIGTEQTFESDTIDTYFMYKELVRMTEGIAFELRSQNKLTGCITVKIRYSDFQTYTKQESINYTAADHILLRKVKELFSKLYNRRQLIRLIGVRFTDLIPGNYQINLFDDTQELIKLYQAIDSVKSQYGEPLLMRASGFDKNTIHRRITDKIFRPFKF
jgi:DNA polymerase IV